MRSLARALGPALQDIEQREGYFPDGRLIARCRPDTERGVEDVTGAFLRERLSIPESTLKIFGGYGPLPAPKCPGEAIAAIRTFA